LRVLCLVLALSALLVLVTAKPRKSPALDIWYKNRAKKFHEAWGKQEGVVTLENGLQYKVLEKSPNADAGARPKDGDTVLLRYQVFVPDEDAPYRHLIGANVFFDKEKKELKGAGNVMKMTQLLDGWRRALQMMTEGDVWEVYVPHEMAYGGLGRTDTRPAVPVFSPIIVTVWLDKINPPPPAEKPAEGDKVDPAFASPTGKSQEEDDEEKKEL